MKKKLNIDVAYLKRCKESSAEAKLDWLDSALRFGKAKKKVVSSDESSKV